MWASQETILWAFNKMFESVTQLSEEARDDDVNFYHNSIRLRDALIKIMSDRKISLKIIKDLRESIFSIFENKSIIMDPIICECTHRSLTDHLNIVERNVQNIIRAH